MQCTQIHFIYQTTGQTKHKKTSNIYKLTICRLPMPQFLGRTSGGNKSDEILIEKNFA